MNQIYYYFPWFGPSGFDTRDAMVCLFFHNLSLYC
mgnify:CR=1 FL=1